MPPRSAAESPARAVLGRVVAADRLLPGLPIAPTGSPAPFLPLTIRDADPAELDRVVRDPCGIVTIDGGPVLTLARRAGDGDAPPCDDRLGDRVWILDVSDTGRWTIAADRLALALRPGADLRAVALDLVGHAVPLALHTAGIRTLHAAAVGTPAGALLLVAPRGAGKSALAAACAAAGAPLAADDAAPVEWRDGTPHVVPAGLPLRLRPDVADALGLAGTDDGWGKRRVTLPVAAATPLPIAAVALVVPAPADAPLVIEPLPARAAAAHLAAGWKLAPLLGRADAARGLASAAELAGAVPVLRVAVPRDLARLRAHAGALLAHVAQVARAGQGQGQATRPCAPVAGRALAGATP